MIIPREKPLFTRQQAADFGAKADIAPRRWEERLVYKMVDPWGTAGKTYKIGLIILAAFLVLITACLAVPLVIHIDEVKDRYEDRVSVVIRAYNLVVRKELSLDDVRCLRGMSLLEMSTKLDEWESMETRALRIIPGLCEGIRCLESRLNQIDEFVASHPELMEKVQEALKHYEPVYAKCRRPSTDDLDPSKPIQKMALLGLKKIELEFQLDERKIFLERNPKVFECFKKYVMEGPNTRAFKSFSGMLTG